MDRAIPRPCPSPARRRALALALAALALPLAAPGARAQDRTSKEIPTGPFHALWLSGIGRFRLVQGDREAVTIEAPSGAQARVHLENRDGELLIEVKDARSGVPFSIGGPSPGPRITVAFKRLDELRSTGGIKVESERLSGDALFVQASGATSLRLAGLELRSLRFEASGAAKIELDGRVAEQSVEISGAGEYRAGDLASEEARIQVSGAGKVVVNAARSLDVEVSGAGLVEYVGNPAVKQEVTGAGRIRRRDRTAAREGEPEA